MGLTDEERKAAAEVCSELSRIFLTHEISGTVPGGTGSEGSRSGSSPVSLSRPSSPSSVSEEDVVAVFQLLQIMGQTGPANMDSAERERFLSIRHLFQEIGEAMHVAPALLAGVAKRESDDFRPESRNPESGAYGIMQVMPSTADAIGVPYERLSDPEVAIRAGATVLKDQGYGVDPLPEVLAGYGGFETVDPGPYIRYVLTAYYAFWWHHGLGLRPTSF